jgi:hypothetical protein
VKISPLVLVLAAATLSAAPTPERTEFEYTVIEVKKKLLLASPEGERKLTVGDLAHSGDSLRTGSRSSADLEVIERAARFHLGAKTAFRLTHDRPGVLIEIERGSLRAIFGPLAEGEDTERLVTTPSAVLAVRGTEYGVEVEKDGDTTVAVFEGIVEVTDLGGKGDVLRVGAGQSTRIKRGKPASAPRAHGLSRDDWDRGRRVSGSGQSGRQGAPGMGAGFGAASGSGSSSSRGGGSKRHGG